VVEVAAAVEVTVGWALYLSEVLKKVLKYSRKLRRAVKARPTWLVLSLRRSTIDMSRSWATVFDTLLVHAVTLVDLRLRLHKLGIST